MKSKISFFNQTVFKKNLSMFWPVWVCYLLYELIKVPGQLWSQLQQSRLSENVIYAAVRDSLSLKMDILVIAAVAVICGMALFGYLFTQKNAYMIHALPVTRMELYFTNLLSGMSFLLIPQFLVFLVTVVLFLAKGIACVQFLAIWLLNVMGIAFFLFSTVCFCAMFTGQMFALPVYFVVVNYASAGLFLGGKYVASFLGCGLSIGSIPDYRIFQLMSPMNYIFDHVDIQVRDLYDDQQNVISSILSYHGGKVLAGYVLLAFVFYALAYYCYKKRRIESAGDLITFKWVKPVFRWGVGICTGYLVSLFLAEFFESVNISVTKPLICFLIAVFGICGFFVAQMFVEKGFRVFRKKTFAESGLFVLFAIGSFWCIAAGTTRLEQYIPDVQDVKKVYISFNFPAEYTKDNIQAAVDIQKMILENATEFKNADADNYASVEIKYKLKNKKSVVRSYLIPADMEDSIKIGQIMRKYENETDNFMTYLVGSDYKDITKFGDGNLTLDASTISYKSTEFSQSVSEQVYEALLADAKEGTLQKYNLSNPLVSTDSTEPAAGLSFDFKHSTVAWQDVYQRESGTTQMQELEGMSENSICSATLYVSFGEDCRHIIQTLVDTGVVKKASEIHYVSAESYDQ